MNLFQEIIDIIRLKKVKVLLRTNKLVLKGCLNFAKVIGSDKLFVSILRFTGAKIGKNFKCGVDTIILNPQNLVVGDNCIFGDRVSIYAWYPVEIGSNTFTSNNIVFLAGSHAVDDFHDLTQGQEIKIGNGVWIGASTTFLGGSIVPNGCIVGAGALCRGGGALYEPFSVIAGVPAKVIKKRIPANVIKQPIEYNLEDIIDK